jgi:hypothetical protein
MSRIACPSFHGFSTNNRAGWQVHARPIDFLPAAALGKCSASWARQSPRPDASGLILAKGAALVSALPIWGEISNICDPRSRQIQGTCDCLKDTAKTSPEQKK